MTGPAPALDWATLRCVAWHGRALGRLSTLAPLLDDIELVPPSEVARAQAVLAWGQKPSAARAAAWAARHGLPVLRVEDGFLRSVALGPDEPPLSLALDDLGIYYDAARPSRLEAWIGQPLTDPRRARAQALRQAWCDGRVSKYNHDREGSSPWQPGDVLVVDQTAGDASVAGAGAGPADFRRMLEAALDEHPRARVWVKVHPDVVAGRKKGHFEPRTARWGDRVRWLSAAAHAPALLERAAEVYVVSSQMGFEALLWGRPVRCFGLPFYAGWGLTRDDPSAPARRRPVALEALVHAALVDYPRYLDPESGRRCEVERLLDWMALQRRERERLPADLSAVGFSGWKQASLRRFVAGSTVHPVGAAQAARADRPVLLWGQRAWPAAAPGRVLRVEDGFLRSVGLGADLVRPLSWVIDGRGLHYDARRPSDLEHLLAHAELSPELCERAARLRERLVAAGLTKYNLAGRAWQRPAGPRPVVLVIGQVESDASLALGAPGIRTNLGLLQAVRAERPGAWLVYRPHPDVQAGLRDAGAGEAAAARWCDEVAAEPDILSLITQVDEVHVLTSLTGFEALLRGRRVVCWGLPFYAGWGLTEDRVPAPRRGRPRTLDELVAAALLLYPRYLHPRSGHFTTAEGALQALCDWRDRAPARPVTGLARLWQGLRRAVLRRAVAWRRARHPVEMALVHNPSPKNGRSIHAGDGPTDADR